MGSSRRRKEEINLSQENIISHMSLSLFSCRSLNINHSPFRFKDQITLVKGQTAWCFNTLASMPCETLAALCSWQAAMNLSKWPEIIWQASCYFSMLKLLWMLYDSLSLLKMSCLVELFLFIWLGRNTGMEQTPGIVSTVLQISALVCIKLRSDALSPWVIMVWINSW